MEVSQWMFVFLASYLVASCSAGSQVVQCVVKMCPEQPPANMTCQYIRDEYNCPTCNLKCDKPGCEPLDCPNTCYNGYVQDGNGCDTCQCKPGCPQRPCPHYRKCRYGFVEDSTGCPTCMCKPKPLLCHRFLICGDKGVCPYSCSCNPFCYQRRSDDSALDLLQWLRNLQKNLH